MSNDFKSVSKKDHTVATVLTQRQRFIKASQELGEISEAAFNKVLKRVGKATVPARTKKAKTK